MASENNNSDYNKTRINLLKYLPEVYHSDTNRAVFENLFNRFLTKQEVEKVAGYIGKAILMQLLNVKSLNQLYTVKHINYNRFYIIK